MIFRVYVYLPEGTLLILTRSPIHHLGDGIPRRLKTDFSKVHSSALSLETWQRPSRGLKSGGFQKLYYLILLRVLDLSHPFWHEVTPLQGTTRKIKSPHEIKKSPHHWQITKAQHAQKFNRTLWYRSRISSCLCIMPNIRSQNQHLLINRPLAQQVRQSNPLKLLSYLSVLIQKGLHTLA